MDQQEEVPDCKYPIPLKLFAKEEVTDEDEFKYEEVPDCKYPIPLKLFTKEEVKDEDEFKYHVVLWKGFNMVEANKLLAVGISALIITLIVTSVIVYKDATSGSNECKTRECIKTAKRIVSYMDTQVDPCDDFYRFACGKFLKKTHITDDRTREDSFTEVTNTLNKQLKQLIYEMPRRDDARPVLYLKKFFRMCLDEEAIEKRGTGHVVERLKKAGGWPVLGNWQENNWNWFTTELLLSQMNMNSDSFFTFAVMEDIGSSDRRVIWIDQSDLPLPLEYMKKGAEDPVLQALLKYMVEVAVALGATRDDRLQKSLRQVLDFQIKLANIQTPNENRRDFNRMRNLKNLNEILEDDRLNWIDWRTYFNTIMPKGVTLKDDELFIITELDFFKQLKVLIRDTPKEVIANHMMFIAVDWKVYFLPKKFQDLQLDVSKVVFGMKTEIPRWEMCTQLAQSLNLALSSLYVQKFFDHSSKEAALDIATRVRDELIKDLKELDWMDAATREKAESKASVMFEVIGYPEEITNIAKLEEHYAELNLNIEHFFEAHLVLKAWATQYNFKLLREPVNKKDWRHFGSMAIVNAHFNAVSNAMVFPAGILQPPFFGSKLPSYVNYASIGFVMGHEMTHGFDDQGCQFNAKGDLENWWNESSKQKFKEKRKCVVDQYAAFKEPQTQLNLNGINTQGENVADIGGLKMAFRAYRHRASQLEKPEAMLPGLKQYTREQLFMISFANVWCSVTRPGKMKNIVLTDSHSPSEFRVNGMLMNLEEFKDLFQCKPGSPMNPRDKCNVW